MAKKITRITDMGTVIQSIYGDSAGVIKVAEAGLEYKILGALTAAVRVGPAASLRIFNSGGSVAYVSFGTQTMAAPTGPTDGIPVLAGAYLCVSSGDLEWVRGSAATVYGYQGDAN